MPTKNYLKPVWLLLFFSLPGFLFCQNKKAIQTRVKWTNAPFDNHVFIQNNGQFDGKINSNEKILYGVQLGYTTVYFTNTKVVYRYDEDISDPSQANTDPDEAKNVKHEVHYLSATWEGANKDVSILAKDEKSDYYSYGKGLNGTIKANIFRQIIYKNLYPGVDAVYGFIKGKAGIKYSLIIHPGADLSKVKIDYSGAKKIQKNRQGDIIIISELKIFTEHAPICYYQGESGNISFSNTVVGNSESFIPNQEYDKSKTLVIDPWVTDPLFSSPGWDRAYDLDWDNYGNVYVYGGLESSLLQLVKMNSAGVIQWTYNTPSRMTGYYGDFCTDKVTGTSYLVHGFSGGIALKVNTVGSLVGSFAGNPGLDELWRAEFDACNGDIVIAGGGTSGTYQAGVLDSNMSAINAVNIMGATNSYHDVCMLTIDPNGTQCYMTSAYSVFGDHAFGNNQLMLLPLPSLSPTAYQVYEQLGFKEVSSVAYCGSPDANGFNGAAASPNWLYLYNGDTIRRYNKTTGNFANQYPIRAVASNSSFEYGGFDVDACDNMFVGVADSLYILDSTYALQTKIVLPDTVYDVHLGENGTIYACGEGFVTQITEPITVRLISSTVGSPTSCSACNGRATVNINCGVAPYSFLWSNGSTNETDTGLCAGIYSVRVTDGACPPHSDTAIVNISGKPGYTASVVDSNPDCGISKGYISVYPTGGTSPYTYLWSNGSTNQIDTGLIAGTYTCAIIDNAGCKFDVSVTLTNPTSPSVSVVPANDSVCSGTNIVLNASGAKTYNWLPNVGLSCNNCPSPTATPSVTTTYTVTGADSLGCTGIATTTIKILPGPHPIISGKDSVCAGYSDTLTAIGGVTYAWSTGATTTSIVKTISSTQTLTVTAYNGTCSHDTTYTIYVVPPPTAVVSPATDSICEGDSLQLSGSGGITYKWSTGSTSTSIWVVPSSTTTYTLQTYAGTCSASATVTVYITPIITATITAINDTVCPNDTTTLIVAGLGGAATYLWNNGSTTSSISVTNTVTTTYTATIIGKCNTVQKFMTVTVVPLPIPVISGTDWKCKGVKDTLTVSGGTSYLWSNGSTSATYKTGPINADSTIKVTAYNSLGCPKDTTFTITLRTITITIPSYIGTCSGGEVLLTANASGTSPYTYLWEPGGHTYDTVTVAPDSATTYTVTVSNGCKAAKIITVTPTNPNLSACCDKTIFLGDDTTIVAYGDTSIKSYIWSPAVNCLNPPLCDSVRVTPTTTTTYTVLGTDSQGCQVEKVVTIIVDIPCFNFTVPNVITPGNPGPSGLNNQFYIKTDHISSWSIVIYDRWGKEMYNSTNAEQYWSGNTEGGAEAPDGVYYYIINATCEGNNYKKDGFVQLIR